MRFLIPVFFDRPAVKRGGDGTAYVPHGDLLIEFPYLGGGQHLAAEPRAVNCKPLSDQCIASSAARSIVGCLASPGNLREDENVIG